MLDYKGEKCLSCGREFTDGDDIVVCPECGTPYHRECYLKEGKCINESLHASGEAWKAQDSDEGKVKCQRCGGLNGADFEYCSHCGYPLKAEDTERPFNNTSTNQQGAYGNGGPYGNTGNYGNGPYGGFGGQRGFYGGFGSAPQSSDPFEFYCKNYGIDSNDRIDSIGIKEYFKYLRSNPMYYITKFLRFSKEGAKRSFNFCAFFFPHIFFFFRKMYKQATVYLTISIVTTIIADWFMLSYVDTSTATTYTELANAMMQSMNTTAGFWVMFGVSAFSIVSRVIAGIFANYWYYKKATKDVNQIVTEPLENTERDVLMARKGGTSFMYALLAYFIASYGASILMSLFF